MSNQKMIKVQISDIRDKKIPYSFTGGPFGSDLKQTDYRESGVRIIQLQNIGDGVFLDDYKIYTSEEKAKKLQNCLIYPGDIIIAKMADPLARACIIPSNEDKYLMASDGIRLAVNTESFSVKYILEMINFSRTRRKIERLGTGSTRLRIGLTELSKLSLDVHPLEEQKKIAEILSTWDEAIELKKQQLKEYENYFNQCLNKMFETRDMKQGLVLGSLIVEENKTKNQSSSRGFSGAYPFFTNSTEEVAKKTDYFDFDGKYIIANTGGRAYFDYFEGKFGAMSDCYVFTSKEINVKYLYYWLKRQEKYIDFVGFVGSGLNHLDKKWFKKLPVPVPARSRQEKIVEALDSINFAREKINKQIDLLMLQKQGLMQRLLTGKVRVKLD